ncbi:TIGR02679 domain-containing protein [Ferviditalea candida]|uniref:TIGR02679 domain-containing protein n=1 Tax=Ferviditalea candida TaxID=3108399 RepID=A0ABU5ZL06_9BACL|nr:TIGR02679 domain-containing protein [Paenibacillaceae bacterium T2]
MTQYAGSDHRAKAKAYFSQPGFQRMLAAVWNRYERLERIGGNAVVRKVTQAESEAINSFFGWNFNEGDDISIPLVLFEQELRESIFSIGIMELYRLIEGKALLTRAEKQLLSNAEWHRLFDEVRQLSGEEILPITNTWLSKLSAGQGVGWRTLRELFRDNHAKAQSSLTIVVRALHLLFAEYSRMEPIRLPVLAARVSGDAHALDISEPAGRMLVAVLQSMIPDEAGQQTAPAGDEDASDQDGSKSLKLRQLYRMNGILDDDLSSIVYWSVPEYGKPLLRNVWTLRQVEAAEHVPRCSRIYIVENPAVFSTLIDSMSEPLFLTGNPPALVCTSGPASAAAIRWLQRCIEVSDGTCSIYYSGDFDVKGISMAQTLQGLFPERFTAWRFDCQTYEDIVGCLPGPSLNGAEISKLQTLSVSWDDQLCKSMSQKARKVHQEAFVDQLVKDWKECFD